MFGFWRKKEIAVTNRVEKIDVTVDDSKTTADTANTGTNTDIEGEMLKLLQEGNAELKLFTQELHVVRHDYEETLNIIESQLHGRNLSLEAIHHSLVGSTTDHEVLRKAIDEIKIYDSEIKLDIRQSIGYWIYVDTRVREFLQFSSSMTANIQTLENALATKFESERNNREILHNELQSVTKKLRELIDESTGNFEVETKKRKLTDCDLASSTDSYSTTDSIVSI